MNGIDNQKIDHLLKHIKGRDFRIQERRADSLATEADVPFAVRVPVLTLPNSEVTQLLQRWSKGDKSALDALMPLVYEDLRRLAGYYLKQEARAKTLQSTAL